MTTITVELDPHDEAALDRLAARFGSRAAAIQAAIRHLAAEQSRTDALDEFLDSWAEERGPVDEAAVRASIERFGLGR